MRGRQIGAWMGNRAADERAQPEAEAGQARRPWVKRGLPLLLVLMLTIGVGYWIRREGAYQRFISGLNRENVEYVEYQPYPNLPFVKVSSPSEIRNVIEWLGEGFDRRYATPNAADCEMRLVMKDGSITRLTIGATGPIQTGGKLVFSSVYVPIKSGTWERAAFSHTLNRVYERLPAGVQLPIASIPVTPVAASGVPSPTAGEVMAAAAQEFMDKGQFGQAQRMLARALAIDPNALLAQQAMADVSGRIRFRLPVAIGELEKELPENGVLNRADYLRLRERVMEAGLMAGMGDEKVAALRERLAKARPAVDPRGFNELVRLAKARPEVDPRAFNELVRLDGRQHERYSIADLAWSPDGATIATCGHDGQVRLWDAGSGKVLYSFAASNGMTIKFSEDGRRVVVASGGAGKWWDLTSGMESAENKVADDGKKHSFSAEVDGTDNVLIRVGSEVVKELAGHAGEVRIAKVSPDGDQIATFGEDRVLSIWGEGPASRILQLQPYERVRQIQTLDGPSVFAPDGSIVTFREGTGGVVEGKVGQFRNLTFNLPAVVGRVEFSANKQRLLVEMQDGKMAVIDLASKRILNCPRPEGSSGRIGLSHDGKRIGVGNLDGSVQIIDLESGQTVTKLIGRPVEARKWAGVSFSSDGGWVLACGEGQVAVWVTSNGEQILNSKNAFAEGIPAVFTPDGKGLAMGYRNGPVVMLTGILRERDANSSGESTLARALAFNPDGRHIAAIGKERNVHLHDAKTMRLFLVLGIKSLGGDADNLKFTEDGRILAVKVEDRSVQLFDVVTGREVRLLKLNDAKYGRGWMEMPMSFSPDGKYLIAGPMIWGGE